MDLFETSFKLLKTCNLKFLTAEKIRFKKKNTFFWNQPSNFCSSSPNMCDRTKRIGYRQNLGLKSKLNVNFSFSESDSEDSADSEEDLADNIVDRGTSHDIMATLNFEDRYEVVLMKANGSLGLNVTVSRYVMAEFDQSNFFLQIYRFCLENIWFILIFFSGEKFQVGLYGAQTRDLRQHECLALNTC
jgi:hypothetical protein